MEMSPLFFYLFAGMAIGFSLMVVLKKNPVASAFSLVMVFFCFAAIYAMQGAHLLAALQILVYAGAIMVLFVFVIMLLNADAPSLDMGRTGLPARIVAGALCAGLVALCAAAFRHSPLTAVPKGPYNDEFIAQAGGNTQVISRLLFSEWILPFEAVGLLLLAGLIGSVAIAKRKLSTPEGGPHAAAR
jgi:NADH-quinone oxidoreductase subunit J